MGPGAGIGLGADPRAVVNHCTIGLSPSRSLIEWPRELCSDEQTASAAVESSLYLISTVDSGCDPPMIPPGGEDHRPLGM